MLDMQDLLAFVLAGGQGARLMPLTAERAKPAVPFGGKYRIIDFVLSNLVNSGCYKLKVLTQYKADSLIRHIQRGWRFSPLLPDQFIDIVPAQRRRGKDWYLGTADAVYQNANLIADEQPKYVAVFGGDHIYRMDVRQKLAAHIRTRAAMTVSCIPVPIEEASAFGILAVDKAGRVISFTEKPARPEPMPGHPDLALASMGNYVFTTDILLDLLDRDAADPNSSHDFGKDIIPTLVRDNTHAVYAYDFSKNRVPGQDKRERGYWRDVGTIDAYYEANMGLRAVSPVFNLYNKEWPVITHEMHGPPVKFVFAGKDRRGIAEDSILSSGVIISGGHISGSVVGRDVFVHSWSRVEDSMLFQGVEIGRHARVRRAIVDRDVVIQPYSVIGEDPASDRQRGLHVTKGGIVVINHDNVDGVEIRRR